MPSLLSPTHHPSKVYAPLTDDTTPLSGNTGAASVVTRNGTVVYGQRGSSTGSIASSSAGSDDLVRMGTRMRNDSEETLSPSTSRKGKGRASAFPTHVPEVDIGDIHRSSYKGKERAWEVEQGRQEVMLDEPFEENSRYPPMHEAQEEERQIQDHLSQLAARDMARRRAARDSKLLDASPVTTSSPRSSFSLSSVARRPMSFLGTASKRGSMMGIDGLFGTKKDSDDSGELPMSRPRSLDAPYINPYEAQPAFSSIPKASQTPPPVNQSPFADPIPPPIATITGPSGHGRPSLVSPVMQNSPRSLARSPLASPGISPTSETGFSYGGPTWRGGQAVHEDEPRRRGPDRWWYALCSWGNDLDGGHDVTEGNDGQAGRTNPFE